MRNLLILCTMLVVALAGACVSFDPSGQPMGDDAVDPAPQVDAGVNGTAPDAAATPTPPVPPPPIDAAPDDDEEENDNSGPGNGGGGGGGGGGN